MFSSSVGKVDIVQVFSFGSRRNTHVFFWGLQFGSKEGSVDFSAGSHAAITQICTFALKHGSPERRPALCKCHRSDGEVAAWPSRHFEAKNEGPKAHTLEVNRAKHITGYRADVCSTAHCGQRVSLLKVCLGETKYLFISHPI